MGMNPRILQSNLTAEEVFVDMWRTLSEGKVWHGELINRRKNGQTYWEDSQIAPVKDAQGVITHYVAVKTDVTERVRSKERVDALLRQQNAILQNKLIGILIVEDRTIIWTNPAFEKMLGYTATELVGASTRHIFKSDEAFTEFGAAAYPVLASGGIFRSQMEHVRKDGSCIWVDVSGSKLDPTGGESLWGFIDITDNKRLEAEVRAQAFHDPMTRLANRRMLNDRLGQAMALSKRSARYGAVLALDLDNFKPLNDQHGHLVGDMLLIEVARRLTACVRQVDTVARVGGDEFVIVLADLDTEASEAQLQAKGIAEKIRLALAEPYVLTVKKGGQAESVLAHHCSASIGLVLFANQETPQEEVLNRADTAMYQAKKSGKNAIRFHAPDAFT
jgi:diguanylate cyclase (GGDEF)-like protein/PAS domain S-box-containing protein